MSMAVYNIGDRPTITTRKSRRKYQQGPHWSLLRHAVRNCSRHGPCNRTLCADEVGDEILASINNLGDRGLHVLIETYRALAGEGKNGR
jgi:hypothetical protein